LFISSIAYADIGPHPSLSFTITNLKDYPAYGFFYQERGIGRVYPINEGSNGVYWLSSEITVYATKENVNSIEVMDKNTVDALVASSVKSNSLTIGEDTQFKIASFNETTKTMELTKTGSQPSPGSYPPDVLDCGSLSGLLNTYCLFSPMWGIIPIAIILLAIIAIVFFAFKHFRKAKP
jgi:hypothetical protein